MRNTQKVLVALSGGVDSSVSAALLKERGYEVSGAFIKTWTAPWLPCTWPKERLDAMRVAAHLRIPFYTVDLSKEYEHDVVNRFVAEYAAGRTPNPDVLCNSYIKFGGFLDWARARGFPMIATGHYAQVRHTPKEDGDVYALFAGNDTDKDQSYFLWMLTQDQLASTLFPVGEYEKPGVRALATQYGLPTAEKKDSQGICFLGQVDMADFLAHYIDTKKGAVLDQTGRVVGEHDGALLYTLGERHGFRVVHTSADEPPRYVVAKDIEANTITVAPRNETTHAVQGVTLAETNWIGVAPELLSQRTGLSARFRYRQPLIPVTVPAASGDGAQVVFSKPQQYVAEGQSLVLYEGTQCLGGGVIVRTRTSTSR